MSDTLGKKAILNHKERANQTLCDSQWKNIASSEKQPCPQIKPEPDCGYWPNYCLTGHLGARAARGIRTGMQSAKRTDCRKRYRINNPVSSTNNFQEKRFKKKTLKDEHLRLLLKTYQPITKCGPYLDSDSNKL